MQVDNIGPELKAELLEQEHRLPTAVVNYFKYKNLPRNDIRKIASRNALIWCLFGFLTRPSSVALTAGGAVTVVLAIAANNLLEQQNQLIVSQNYLSEAQRRASLNIEVTATLDKIDADLRSFNQNLCGSDNNDGLCNKVSSLYGYPEKGPNIRNEAWVLSPTVEGRIIGLTRALQPYRLLDVLQVSENRQSSSFFAFNRQVMELSDPISPEKGTLLQVLYSSQIYLNNIRLQGVDFSYSFLENSNFDSKDFNYLNLKHSKFNNSKLNSAKFCGSVLDNADFSHSIMEGTLFGRFEYSRKMVQYTSLEDSSFIKADLDMSTFYGVKLKSANFSESIVGGSLFFDADLTNANFSNADMESARFYNTKMENVTWSGAKVKNAIFIKPEGLNIAEFRKAKDWQFARFDAETAKNLGIKESAIESFESHSKQNDPCYLQKNQSP